MKGATHAMDAAARLAVRAGEEVRTPPADEGRMRHFVRPNRATSPGTCRRARACPRARQRDPTGAVVARRGRLWCAASPRRLFGTRPLTTTPDGPDAPARAASDLGPGAAPAAGLAGLNIAALVRASKKFRGSAERNRQKRLPKLTAHCVLRRQYRAYKQVIAAEDDAPSVFGGITLNEFKTRR